MATQPGFFDVEERLGRLSAIGDQLEAYAAVLDFEIFRADLEAALGYADGARGGRPPYDPVLMFKILVIQAQHGLSDDKAEFLVNDRLSFMRFLGLGLSDRVPDAKTIWMFRERLFRRFDAAKRPLPERSAIPGHFGCTLPDSPPHGAPKPASALAPPSSEYHPVRRESICAGPAGALPGGFRYDMVQPYALEASGRQ